MVNRTFPHDSSQVFRSMYGGISVVFGSILEVTVRPVDKVSTYSAL